MSTPPHESKPQPLYAGGDVTGTPPARPTAETDPGACRWCFEEAVGGEPCPYHGERAQRGVE